MLEHLDVLIVGGDARTLNIIEELADQGAKLHLLGFDQISFSNPHIHHVSPNDSCFQNIDAIVLPVAGTDEKGIVDAEFSKATIYITEQKIARTNPACVIYTGTANDYLNDVMKKTGRKMITLFDRDDLAILNSIPTAEGALQLAIENSDITIHGANVCILGFGRVGMTIARLFAAVGAHVHVAARKNAHRARIIEMGLKPVQLEDIVQVAAKMDIFINTIPKNILDANLITNMKESALIIDLASKPGGTDFTYAKNKGIQAIHALGLPGKTAPKTAGKILADVLIELFTAMEQ